MLSCWKADPIERLPFSDLVDAIETMLTKVADYLDINEFTLSVDHSSDDKCDKAVKRNSAAQSMESSL